MDKSDTTTEEFDFIVVGAGAGGATVASRLALLGHRVAVLDAGASGDRVIETQVPLFHPYASENSAVAWQMYVRHYADNIQQKSDSKCQQIDGRSMILYPRGTGLGGSTLVHAMIAIYPHESDWQEIARLTKDDSWRPDRMRLYFQSLERCQYRHRPVDESNPKANPGAHGFSGWLPTLRPALSDLLSKTDANILRLLTASVVVPLLQQAPADLQRLLTAYQSVRPLLIPQLTQWLGPLFDSAKLADDFLFYLASGLLEVDDQIPDDNNENAIEEAVAAIRQTADRFEQVIAHPQERSLQLIWLVADIGNLRKCIRQLWNRLDPNDLRFTKSQQVGPCFVPMSIDGVTGHRFGLHKRLAEVQSQVGDRLRVIPNALVARIHLVPDQGGCRATGVEFFPAARAYSAASDSPNQKPHVALQTISCRREVILAGGTFNTPQVLMLSGIGPIDVLNAINTGQSEAEQIPTRISLPGVGKNLQDRYEIGIVFDMPAEFASLKDSICTPDVLLASSNDAAWKSWLGGGKGIYASNGSISGFILKSPQSTGDPDLFLFSLPGDFHGYFNGYSKGTFHGKARRQLSWIILKAHTRNRSGQVTLRSLAPWQQPEILFNSFDATSDPGQLDVKAVVHAIEFVRKLMRQAAIPGCKECLPGNDVTGKALVDWIQSEAWGHHAGGTCAIGADDDPQAVLATDFRVRGTSNLRVVDASIFPRLPGFFPFVPVCMVGEKAASVIHQATQQPPLTPAKLPTAAT